MPDTERFRKALARIDARNAADPNQEQGRPKELLYSERMTSWLERLEPNASEALRLAVRAQHLERWKSPRSAYSADRAGYRAWRIDASRRHAEAASSILREAGFEEATRERVAALIRKERLKQDAEAQTLEDCASLVFLESYSADFAEGRDDVELKRILKRTWNKMSERGHEAASALKLPERLSKLLAEALDE